MKNTIGAILFATALAACGGVEKNTTHAKDQVATVITDSGNPPAAPEGTPGSPPTLDEVILQGIFVAPGQEQIHPYSINGQNIAIIFINNPAFGSLGGGLEGSIVINMAQVSLAHQMTADIFSASGMQSQIPPLELFTKGVLNQELYHVVENGGGERESELPSLKTAGVGEFYLLFRLSGTISGALGDPVGFNQRLKSGQVVDPAGYRNLVEKYTTAIRSVDSDFKNNCPLTGDPLQDGKIISGYLTKNPQFLSSVLALLIK